MTATIKYEGYVIAGNKDFPALKRITREGAGTVPEVLRGLYTSFQAAKDDIDFLNSKKAVRQAEVQARKELEAQKVEENAEADTTVRDEQVHEGIDNGLQSAELS